MRSLPPLAFTAAVALALAGCLADPAPGPTGEGPETAAAASADWARRALPYGSGHDHTDLAQHAGLTTPNFEVLGWDPLVTDEHGTTSGGYFCGGVGAAGERRIAFVNSFTTDVAFVAADVTDPARPEKIGELVLPRTHVYDMDVTPDAAFVLLATSPLDTGPDEGAARARATWAPTWRDACGGETPLALPASAAGPENEVPYAGGVVLVDVRDPTAPVVSDFRPLPVLGAHSVWAGDVDGATVALASVTNLVHGASYYEFFTIADLPGGPKLVTESVYRPVPTGPGEATAGNGHVDGWVQKHPGTGQNLAYLADWNGGLAIVDVTNLKAPLEVARWNDFGARPDGGAVHEAYPLPEMRDGKHYTIIGQEVTKHPRDTPTGVVTILDTTDPAAPATVGQWTLPVDVEWTDLVEEFSTHYVAVVGSTMFVTMYHGGMWAVDIADPATPRSVGVFIPDAELPTPSFEGGGGFLGGFPAARPYVLDAIPLPTGELVVFDAFSGVYVLAFDAASPAPLVDEWKIPGAP